MDGEGGEVSRWPWGIKKVWRIGVLWIKTHYIEKVEMTDAVSREIKEY